MNMISETSLFSLLLAFAKEFRKKLDGLQSEDQFETIKLLYTKPTVTSFEYKDGAVSYSLSFDHIVKKKRFIKNQSDFIEREIKSISGYSRIVTDITKRSGCSESKAEHMLRQLFQYLERDDVSVSSDEMLPEVINIFISDINNSQTYWKNTIFVNGIWLKEKSYQVNDEIRIRQPQKSDYEKENLIAVPTITFSTFPSSFSAVIEFDFLGKSSQENQKAVNVLINTFQLFRLGSVAYEAFEFKPKSITRHSATLGFGGKHSTYYKYVINPQDITDLKSFISKIMPLVSKYIATDNVKSNLITIAFKRYLDSLLHGRSFENRITSAITCLESLYLKGEERMELCHRLSQRVSALLCLLDLDYKALEIYNHLMRAYDIRSTFIHGDSTAEKHCTNLPTLCESVMQYARISILVFLQLMNVLEKEKIINKLDNSLLDKNAHEKLIKTICESKIVVI